MKSNRTKGKILETSIKLFNEKKASNVSTVQISAAMEISPETCTTIMPIRKKS